MLLTVFRTFSKQYGRPSEIEKLLRYRHTMIGKTFSQRTHYAFLTFLSDAVVGQMRCLYRQKGIFGFLSLSCKRCEITRQTTAQRQRNIRLMQKCSILYCIVDRKGEIHFESDFRTTKKMFIREIPAYLSKHEQKTPPQPRTQPLRSQRYSHIRPPRQT